MPDLPHPDLVLFQGEKPFPILRAVDHYAGSEKLMRKALAVQLELGPVFDITSDCEDGAHAGAEAEHAAIAAGIVMSDDNRFGRVGARTHDITHPHSVADVDILVSQADSRLAFLTIPKPRSMADAARQIEHIRSAEEISILRKLSESIHDYGDVKIKLIPFVAKYNSGDILLTEHKDYKWMEKQDLLTLDWAEADLPIVREFLAI